MTSELKPCPFCGSEGEIYHMLYPYEAYVTRCASARDCFCELGEFHTREQAVSAWNTRTEPSTWAKVFLYDKECVEGIECVKCGYSEPHDHSEPVPKYCPNCHVKVEN